MTPESYLNQSKIWATAALIILIVAAIMELGALPNSSQQKFEVIYNLQLYTDRLAASDPNLRLIIFLDSIFVLCYVAAIAFAAMGFSEKSLPIAVFCGLGILAIGGLDYWENVTMIHSMDLLASGEQVTVERMMHQVQVSTAKWHASATVLFAISFLLPSERLVEKLLVWGTRIGLAIAVPLFITNMFDARIVGGFMLLGSMIGGLALLAVVAHLNSQRG